VISTAGGILIAFYSNVRDGKMADNDHADVDYRFGCGDWFADEDLRLRKGGSTDQLSTGYDCGNSDKTRHRQNPVEEERRRRPSADWHYVGDRVVDDQVVGSKMKPRMILKNKCENSTATSQMSDARRGNRGHVNDAVLQSVASVAVANRHTKGRGGNTLVYRNTVNGVTDIDMRQQGLLGKRSYNSDSKPLVKSEESVNLLDYVDTHIVDRKPAKKVTDADYRKFPSSDVKPSNHQVGITTKLSNTKSTVNLVKCQSSMAFNVNGAKCHPANLNCRLSGVAADTKKSISLLVQKNVKSSTGSVTVSCNNKQSSQLLARNNSKTSTTIAASANDIVANKLTIRVEKGPVTDCTSNFKSHPSLIPLQRTGGVSATGPSPKKKVDTSCSPVKKKKPDTIDDEKSKPTARRVVTVKSLVMTVPISTLMKNEAAVRVVKGSSCSAASIGSRNVAKNFQKDVPLMIKTSPLSSSTLLKGGGNLQGKHEIQHVTPKKMLVAPSPRKGNNIHDCDARTVRHQTVKIDKSIDTSTADNTKEDGCSKKKMRRIVLRRPNYNNSSRNETADNKPTPKRRKWRGTLEPSSEVGPNLQSNDHRE